MFLSILGVFGFLIVIGGQIFKLAQISWYTPLISFTVAVITIIGLIDYVFVKFLNPLPSDYYATDAGEIWQMSLPLVILTFPVFINYIVLGRLDKHIITFKSRLNESIGLYLILSGGLMAIPLIWVNYRILRFGIEVQILDILFYSVLLFQVYSISLGRWLGKILNFPHYRFLYQYNISYLYFQMLHLKHIR
jgi:hypothetical protein